MSIYKQKFTHPHKIQEDGQGNSMDYVAYTAFLPLLFFVHLITP